MAVAKIIIKSKDGRNYLADPVWGARIALALKILVILAVLPIFLLFVYSVPFVRPISTLMVKDYVLFQGVDRRWVSIDDIAPVLVNSVMMAEDGQFCSHGGVDWHQLGLVLDDTGEGGPSRGASTITMQTVKNLFLWNGRSYVRKGLEFPLALAADGILSKKRIMEIYLNIAEWGPGIYGIEAAAQHHFKRPAAKLNAQQSALLAVTLPNPALRNPAKPTRNMQRIARIVAGRAARSGPYVVCVQ
ncbi:monofunctional biosynthetic peptidoglycan transglycosylase [Brucella anthropi]|uniref:Biosynthetic peptidoglycan transglycosylase n=3 Tax=Brucella TaxID=234 RepID=A6WXZ3_BRUA4|nr:monofunctional biosynthetic peptidoglycan transglycosylase [Brucella anthropi ATCC 49188]AIK43251.1 monofunctional biosynthetic peptidoglycan transglycosylase [Brucella anthropi]KAB2702779.1 monofunctional biosynthetic peptidoglycan transglycosylase [Brucella lupini]MCR5943113.1 monofunctional biosynthetic peptidoglycan transglycosylase [Ochrobactrum sp. XJ1]NIH77033.1 monofunctional biosynthetic peptidoglycan transglycosylase [Ochrobactrum sp. P20RRXII]PQZ66900.1 monofunctional biosyntheti